MLSKLNLSSSQNKENSQPKFFSVPSRHVSPSGKDYEKRPPSRLESRFKPLGLGMGLRDPCFFPSSNKANEINDLELFNPLTISRASPSRKFKPDSSPSWGGYNCNGNIRVVKTRNHKRAPIISLASTSPVGGKLFPESLSSASRKSSLKPSLQDLTSSHAPASLKLSYLPHQDQAHVPSLKSSTLLRSQIDAENNLSGHGTKSRRRALSRFIGGLQAKSKALVSRPSTPRLGPTKPSLPLQAVKGGEGVCTDAGTRKISVGSVNSSVGSITRSPTLSLKTSNDASRLSQISASPSLEDCGSPYSLISKETHSPKRRLPSRNWTYSCHALLPVRPLHNVPNEPQASTVVGLDLKTFPEVEQVDCNTEEIVWTEIVIETVFQECQYSRERESGVADLVVIVDNSSPLSSVWFDGISKLISRLGSQFLSKQGDRIAVIVTDCGNQHHINGSTEVPEDELCIVRHLLPSSVPFVFDLASLGTGTCQEAISTCPHFIAALKSIAFQRERDSRSFPPLSLNVIVCSPIPESFAWAAREMRPFAIHNVFPSGNLTTEYPPDCAQCSTIGNELSRLTMAAVVYDYDESWLEQVLDRLSKSVYCSRQKVVPNEIKQAHIQLSVTGDCILEETVGDSWIPCLRVGETARLFAKVRVPPLSRRSRKRFRAVQTRSMTVRPLTPDIDDMEYDIKWMLGEHSTSLLNVQVTFFQTRNGTDIWQRMNSTCSVRRPNGASVWSLPAGCLGLSSPVIDHSAIRCTPPPWDLTDDLPQREFSTAGGITPVLERLAYFLTSRHNLAWADLIDAVAEIRTGRIPNESLDRLRRYFQALELFSQPKWITREGKPHTSDDFCLRTRSLSYGTPGLSEPIGLREMGNRSYRLRLEDSCVCPNTEWTPGCCNFERRDSALDSSFSVSESFVGRQAHPWGLPPPAPKRQPPPVPSEKTPPFQIQRRTNQCFQGFDTQTFSYKSDGSSGSAGHEGESESPTTASSFPLRSGGPLGLPMEVVPEYSQSKAETCSHTPLSFDQPDTGTMRKISSRRRPRLDMDTWSRQSESSVSMPWLPLQRNSVFRA